MNNFDKKLDFYKKQIELALKNCLNDPHNVNSKVLDAMEYALLTGGKRVRGVLTLAHCEMLGGQLSDALAFASSVEMIHAYSLVHDDLPCMDNDDLRRGKPSCHKKFGEDIALLAGDGLLTMAFNVMTSSQISPDAVILGIKLLSSYSGVHGMIGGQEIDLISEDKDIDGNTLKKMHSLKTAALIQCACELGVIAANGSEKDRQIAMQFGYHLGMAFQIYDDILDVTGTQEQLGKPIGSDLQQKKVNYISLFGLEKSKQLAKEYTVKAKEVLLPYSNRDFIKEYSDILLVRQN